MTNYDIWINLYIHHTKHTVHTTSLHAVMTQLPMFTLQPLEHIQKAAARLVLGLSRFDHVMPTLTHLH